MSVKDHQYYCEIRAEFGQVGPDGKRIPKNPVVSRWVDLPYGEAVAFQAMVLAPAIKEITGDALLMGIQKALAEGEITQEMAQSLMAAAGKAEDTRRR